jgi:hypothetical protein
VNEDRYEIRMARRATPGASPWPPITTAPADHRDRATPARPAWLLIDPPGGELARLSLAELAPAIGTTGGRGHGRTMAAPQT